MDKSFQPTLSWVCNYLFKLPYDLRITASVNDICYISYGSCVVTRDKVLHYKLRGRWNETPQRSCNVNLVYIEESFRNRACQSSGHHWDYYPEGLPLSVHWNLFKDGALVDFTYGCPIFEWVAEIWLHGKISWYWSWQQSLCWWTPVRKRPVYDTMMVADALAPQSARPSTTTILTRNGPQHIPVARESYYAPNRSRTVIKGKGNLSSKVTANPIWILFIVIGKHNCS